MPSISYVVGFIAPNEKEAFINWVKTGNIPKTKLKIPISPKYVYPDSKYIWLTLFNHTLSQLNCKYRESNNGIDYDNFLVQNYEKVDKEIPIPCCDMSSNCSKSCLCCGGSNKLDTTELESKLTETPHKLLSLTLYRKIVNKKIFKNLNFNITTVCQIKQLEDYDLTDIIKHLDLSIFDKEESCVIYNYLRSRCYDYDIIWKHPNNKYIVIERKHKPHVSKASVMDILLHQTLDNIKKSKLVHVDTIYTPTFCGVELKINTIHDILHLLKPFKYEDSLEIYQNPELYFMGIVNNFSTKHGTNLMLYKQLKYRLRIMLKKYPQTYKIFKECLKYSRFNPKNNYTVATGKQYMKQVTIKGQKKLLQTKKSLNLKI